MATLDWSQCTAVESIPGKRSGAWVFRDTRTPVSVVFDNLEVGASINEIMVLCSPSLRRLMLILFDNGTPAPLRYALKGHTVVEAIERGWERLVTAN